MGFDVKQFNNSELKLREDAVELPSLSSFFGKDERPAFRVRGLSGPEVAKVREVNTKYQAVLKVVQALQSSGASVESIDKVKDAMGLGDKVPDDYHNRIETLNLGLLEPKLDRQTIVRLAKFFSVEFYTLTDKIRELTGLGPDLGK